MFSAFKKFGKLGALASSVARAWSPLALWPDGIATPGVWISPRDLTSQWADYTGTTPVATPGTVADASNPVGLAYDLRAGTPVLGPELVVNGDFSDGTTGWSAVNSATISTVGGELQVVSGAAGYPGASQVITWTEGHTYEVTVTARQGTTTDTVRIVLPSVVELGYTSSSPVAKSAIVVAVGSSVTAYCEIFNPFDITPGETAYFDNISVREVPGHHMLQATSAARPLLSARRNLLTYTGDLSGWNKGGVVTITPNYGTAPDSTSTSVRVQFSGANMQTWLNHLNGGGNPGILSVWVKGAAGETIQIAPDFAYAYTVTLTGAWQKVENYSAIANAFSLNTYVSSTARDIEVWHPQFERGAAATDYQSVPGDGSTYPSTGFPIAQLYDGVDDGMATAAFSAGTLTAGMDCMIVVRRDSAGACVAGLYNGVADATKFFGMAESGSGSGCVGSGAGTPTVWVDGTQLAGGTAVTRGTLHTALTVGDVHILEFRGLDLSTWASSGFGLYTSYLFTGPRGDILLYPSTDPTEDKDAARQWLADYYGVTLA